MWGRVGFLGGRFARRHGLVYMPLSGAVRLAMLGVEVQAHRILALVQGLGFCFVGESALDLRCVLELLGAPFSRVASWPRYTASDPPRTFAVCYVRSPRYCIG